MNVGTGIVCEVVSNAKIALPNDTLWTKQTLTSFFGYGPPNPADGIDVLVYNDSNTVGNEEDAWKQFTLVSVDKDPSRCLTNFHVVQDAGKNRYVLELSDPLGHVDPTTSGPLSQYIQRGAPVRIVRRVRYSLYKEPSDGKYYLGYANYDAASGAYGTLAPVSGPYDPTSTVSGTVSGVGFRYYDVDGNEIASGAGSAQRKLIARVDLVARARTEANVGAEGIQKGVTQQYKDSLAVSVMLRNRK